MHTHIAQDPVLVALFDRQIWLELTYEVAHARRMATTPMPQSHYDNALWPNYCAYKVMKEAKRMCGWCNAQYQFCSSAAARFA